MYWGQGEGGPGGSNHGWSETTEPEDTSWSGTSELADTSWSGTSEPADTTMTQSRITTIFSHKILVFFFYTWANVLLWCTSFKAVVSLQTNVQTYPNCMNFCIANGMLCMDSWLVQAGCSTSNALGFSCIDSCNITRESTSCVSHGGSNLNVCSCYSSSGSPSAISATAASCNIVEKEKLPLCLIWTLKFLQST